MSSILIYGANKRCASIRLLGFERKPKTLKPHAEWIDIEFLIKSKKKEWHVKNVALTAKEVKQLMQWLYDLGKGVATVKDLCFWEPNISFHLMYNYGGSKIILIIFKAGLRPEWYKEKGDYSMVAHLSNRQLLQDAKSLHRRLQELYIKAEIPFTVYRLPFIVPAPDKMLNRKPQTISFNHMSQVSYLQSNV